MHIIAGLGNPGLRYEGTRHNSGFAAVDLLAEKYGIRIGTLKFHALTGTGMIDGEKVLLLKPQTFMNLSGIAVSEACAYYHADPGTDLIVLHDDISLPPGMLRVRTKGSAGGHNGMKSIIESLNTQVFARVKIGVGEKPAGYDLADWVLGRFSPADRDEMNGAFIRAAGAAADLCRMDAQQVMNRYNTKPASEEKKKEQHGGQDLTAKGEQE